MKCFYISLESAKDRQQSIEESFKRTAYSGWSLERITAFDAGHMQRNPKPGQLNLAEKACFLSHTEAIRRSLSHDGHVFILEDDVIFSDKTFHALDALLKHQSTPTWDLFYTDIGPAYMADMIRLAVMKTKAVAGQVKTLNLREMPFFGATSYLVHERSKAKALGILDAVTSFDVAYDAFLCKAVSQGALDAHAVFPFLTTISDLANTSSIQPDGLRGSNLVSNLFNQLMWIDGSADLHREKLDAIEASLGKEARAFGMIWAALVDKGSMVREV